MKQNKELFTASHGQAGVQSFPGEQGPIICKGYLERQMLLLQILPLFLYGAWHHRYRNSCLSNLISFHNKLAHLAGQGKPALDFSKALDTLSQDPSAQAV